MAENETTGTEQETVEPTYTPEQLEALRDFRHVGWQGPQAEQRRKVENHFDERVAALQALLDAVVEDGDGPDTARLAALLIRRIRALRIETAGYSGLNVNRLDVAKVERW